MGPERGGDRPCRRRSRHLHGDADAGDYRHDLDGVGDSHVHCHLGSAHPKYARSANLGSGAPGTTISAPIGPVTVTDDRALLSASWTVTAAETDFANGTQTIPATDASYAPGTTTTTGVITVTPTSVSLANSAQTVVTGTDGVGDNTATWDPTVTVTVPATAAAGTYTGTLTHSIDPSVTITFTVVPATPSITTSQQPAAAAVGSSIADQATVTGDNPTGTVTFNLYNNPNGTGTPLFTDTEKLSGGVGDVSAGYTATATGTDYWVATYNGDSNNNPVTQRPRRRAGDHQPATPASRHHSAAGRARPAASIADQATVSGAVSPTGTVTFNLCTPTPPGTAPVHRHRDPGSGVATCRRTTPPPPTGTDYWVATYNGDTNNDRQRHRREPVVMPASTIAPVTPGAASLALDRRQGDGHGRRYSPTGTVTFNLYNNSQRHRHAAVHRHRDAVGGVATSAGYTATATGTDYWVATYNGDSNNARSPAARRRAGDDHPATPSITTIQQPATATVGARSPTRPR